VILPTGLLRTAVLLLLFIGSFQVLHAASEPRPRLEFPAGVEGFWQGADEPGYFVGFEGNRLVIAYGGRLREVMRILGATADALRVCNGGKEVTLPIEVRDDELDLVDPARRERHRLRRIDSKPPELEVAPLPIPPLQEIAEARRREIQRELAERLDADQALLRFPNGASSPIERELLRAEQTRANTEYLREIVQQVGWIDAQRFDYGTSNAAFLLAQHSWDVALLLAVRPWIEKDVEAGRIEREALALLEDRLQLSLGERQRYGTQVLRTESGGVVVLPVEDEAAVDRLRREAGLLPLDRYVQVFGASEVVFSQECRADRHASPAATAGAPPPPGGPPPG
jgi:hypothetical protein